MRVLLIYHVLSLLSTPALPQHIALTPIQNPESSLKLFDTTLATNGSDLVAQYGRAKALDELAARRKDNRLLRQSIAAYERLVLELGVDLPDHVFRAMGERCVELMRFIGKLDTHKIWMQ